MSEIDVEIDDEVAVVVLSTKRKRGKESEPSPIPDNNSSLLITLHIITAAATGEQLTKSRKSITMTIENGGFYIENIDLENAMNNVSRPFISASNAHGLVINHLGQRAAEILSKIASGVDPHLSQKLKTNSNPEYLVRSSKSFG